jgi:hypothetical protein
MQRVIRVYAARKALPVRGEAASVIGARLALAAIDAIAVFFQARRGLKPLRGKGNPPIRPIASNVDENADAIEPATRIHPTCNKR